MKWIKCEEEVPNDDEECLIVDLDSKVHSVRCFYRGKNDFYFSKEDGLYFESWECKDIKYWSYFPVPPQD